VTRPLLHPIALGAIAVLLVNDHYLKLHYPGWLTGKLSDAAGLVFFPLLVAVILRMRVTWAAAATAIVFALVKTLPAATDFYRHALGLLQLAIGSDGTPVEAVTDPTDLLALPFVLLAIVVARRCEAIGYTPVVDAEQYLFRRSVRVSETMGHARRYPAVPCQPRQAERVSPRWPAPVL
jgi:hypothetical protein